MGLVPSQAKHNSWLTKVLVGAQNIKFGPKWVENLPFGPKQTPNEPNRLSGPIRTTHEAKNGPKKCFSRKTTRWTPADLGGPSRLYRRRPGARAYIDCWLDP